MVFEVTSAVLESLLAQARAAAPEECCGLLFGTEAAITGCKPTANVHPAPQTRFEIDPQALVDAHRAMRSGGARLVGYYHSHPGGAPEPSATDRALAARNGMVWAIVGADGSGGRVTLWRAGDDGLTPLPYRVTGA